MKKIEYVIEDRTIAEVLGVQNFTDEESAVLELYFPLSKFWLFPRMVKIRIWILYRNLGAEVRKHQKNTMSGY